MTVGKEVESAKDGYWAGMMLPFDLFITADV